MVVAKFFTLQTATGDLADDAVLKKVNNKWIKLSNSARRRRANKRAKRERPESNLVAGLIVQPSSSIETVVNLHRDLIRLRVWKCLSQVGVHNNFHVRVDAAWQLPLFVAVFQGWSLGGANGGVRNKRAANDDSLFQPTKPFLFDMSCSGWHPLNDWFQFERFARVPIMAHGASLFLTPNLTATCKLLAAVTARFDYSPTRLPGKTCKLSVFVTTCKVTVAADGHDLILHHATTRDGHPPASHNQDDTFISRARDLRARIDDKLSNKTI